MIQNPDAIATKGELDDVIAALEAFEKEHGKPAVVVKRQNLSLGSSYDIVSAEQANEKLRKWDGPETYLDFWPK